MWKITPPKAHAGESLPHALAAARAVLLLGSAGGGPKEASEIVARNGLARRGCSVRGAEEAATFLAQECGGEFLFLNLEWQEKVHVKERTRAHYCYT